MHLLQMKIEHYNVEGEKLHSTHLKYWYICFNTRFSFTNSSV